MKALVLWSSRTGNTKAVGKAIYEALPCEKEIFESGRQPKDLSGYDLVYVGFWGSHTGTDIACAEGTPILAAADGTVTVANSLDSWGGSYGYYIQIDHGGGLETLYAHCSSICVATGQQVQAGQVIGYVGHTGRVTGNHLHLEVRIDSNRVDAMQYFTL